jgi:alkylated DNA repair dioxygenase AlkB
MKVGSPLCRFGHDSAEFEYWDTFLNEIDAVKFFDQLLTSSPWREQIINIYGKKMPLPRLTCWYGDKGAAYRYSGIINEPDPWTPILKNLRSRVQEFVGAKFNSVLLNLYRHGTDSLGWHADDESELGDEPTIASVSLGGERRFDVKENNGGVRLQIALRSGSLLVMKSKSQKLWVHSVPKTKDSAPRINLTFRNVVVPSLQGELL